MSAKEQLAYLSQVLGFTVTYNDFPKKGEYLSLVSLSTNPAQVILYSLDKKVQTNTRVGLDFVTIQNRIFKQNF